MHGPSLDCCARYTRKRKTREHEAALNSTSCPEVMEPPRLPPLERVQARVKDIIASGGIVEWRKAGERLRQAREDDSKVGLVDHYTRLWVRNSFYQVLKTPRCNARVVSGRRGPDPSADGRNVYILLFPTVASDQVAVDLYLRGIVEDGRAGGAHLNSAEDIEHSLDDVLQAMDQQGEDDNQMRLGRGDWGGWGGQQ